MAPNSSRNYVLACTIPAAIAVAAYIWVKKKKKRPRIARQRDEIRRSTSLLTNSIADVVSPRTSTTCSNQCGLVEQNEASCSDEKNLVSEGLATETDPSFTEDDKFIEVDELGTSGSSSRAENCSLKPCDSETITLSDSLVIAADECLFVDDKIIIDSISSVSCEEQIDETNEHISAELNSRNFDLTFDSSLESETTCSLCNETCSSDCLHDFSFCSSSSVTSSQLRMLDDSFVNAGEKLTSTPNKADVTYDQDLPDCSVLSVIQEESTAGDSSSFISSDNSSAVVVEDGGEETNLNVSSASNSNVMIEDGSEEEEHVADCLNGSSLSDSSVVVEDGGEEKHMTNCLNGSLDSNSSVVVEDRGEEKHVVNLTASSVSNSSVVIEEGCEEEKHVANFLNGGLDSNSSVMVEDGGEEEKHVADCLNVSSVSSSSLCENFVEKCQINPIACETQADNSENNEGQVNNDVTETELKTDVDPEILMSRSPSLSTEEPELQKLTNGHETSAYGSASQSPAEDLLESPTASNYSDHNEWSHSERSSDSGKCGSDINIPKTDNSIADMPLTQVYEFEIPSQLCGRMIGFKGQHVRSIKAQTRADVAIGPHPYHGELKMCAVLGSESEIRAALELTRKRFPLSKFPDLSLSQVNIHMLSTITIPDTLQLQLPHDVTCDVIVVNVVSAGHFFVQQPTHPTYSSLSRLDMYMAQCYSDESSAPTLPAVSDGVVCAAPARFGWARAQVVYTEDEECDLRYLDYGGYTRHSIYSLRQIRSDFMTLPFQASECYLSNVVPVDAETGWTLEATDYFEQLAKGQILQAQVVSFAENGIPYVQLFRIQGAMSTFINSELVSKGYATWVNTQLT